jgi:hypothetical protein
MAGWLSQVMALPGEKGTGPTGFFCNVAAWTKFEPRKTTRIH